MVCKCCKQEVERRSICKECEREHIGFTSLISTLHVVVSQLENKISKLESDMGYNMNQVNGLFTMKASDFDAALEAIKELAEHPEQMSGYRWYNGKIESRHYSWVTTEAFLKADNIFDALDAWDIELTQEEGEDFASGIQLYSEKLGDEHYVLEAIAPFVEDGSYIDMKGEDDYYWRWSFRNGTLQELGATIDWDSLE